MVAPLNWGLGHATRCIPIITTLLDQGHRVVIASDGEALRLLKKEFPRLPAVSLPSYDITYSEKAKDFKLKMFLQTRHIRKTIKAEHKALKNYIPLLHIDAVISDSRFGMYSSLVPSVIISHQLTVLSGKTTAISSFIHRSYLKKFDECWVPDYNDAENLSGILGHPKKTLNNVKYIGPLHRMKKEVLRQKYNIAVILSGPEPQRSMLEKILLEQLKKYNGTILIVQGLVGKEVRRKQLKNIELVNFLTTQELETVINQSGLIIARSGYTTVMDLAALEKKAFFIPTPGQPEQEYLAHYLKEKKIAPFAKQEDFTIKKLSNLPFYTGFLKQPAPPPLEHFFSFFEREGKLRTHSKFAFNINFLLVRFNNMLHNREAQT